MKSSSPWSVTSLLISLTVSLAVLGEFADDEAGLVSTVGQPDLNLILEGDGRLSEFKRLQHTRLYGETPRAASGPDRTLRHLVWLQNEDFGCNLKK